MSIKVCNHELDDRSLGMNMYIKTYKHPFKKLGNRVREKTPPPPLYDVYTVDDIKPKIGSFEERITRNESSISKGINSILERING